MGFWHREPRALRPLRSTLTLSRRRWPLSLPLQQGQVAWAGQAGQAGHLALERTGGLSRAEQGRVSLPPSARLPGQARAGVHQLCPARLSTSPAAHGRPCHRPPTAAVPSGPADPPPSRPIQVLHGPRPLSSLKCRFRFRSGEVQGRCGRLLTDLLASTWGPCPSVFLKGDQAVLPPWSSLLWVGQATGAAAPRPACRPHVPTCRHLPPAGQPRGLGAWKPRPAPRLSDSDRGHCSFIWALAFPPFSSFSGAFKK